MMVNVYGDVVRRAGPPEAAEVAGPATLSFFLDYWQEVPPGRLHYIGAVGTNISERGLWELRRHLDAAASAPAAEQLVAGDNIGRTIHWIRPALVAEVRLADWSGEGRVPHPAFKTRPCRLIEDRRLQCVARRLNAWRGAHLDQPCPVEAVGRCAKDRAIPAG